jgi:hypothetical protein
MGLGLIVSATPALARQQIYIYSVKHPFYGVIGTYTDMIERSAEATRIDSRLRIAVRFLGIVVYRQEANTTEIMIGNRLVLLQSVTERDGQHLEVHGEVQGNRFVVNATAGASSGPVAISPSDPWVLQHTGEATVVFTDTGRIVDLHISGGDYEAVAVNGISISARHFVVIGDKRQDVWLDHKDIPIMFRTVEDGTRIDFVLQNATTAPALPR